MPADERQKSETAFQLGLRDILLEFVAPVMIMFILVLVFTGFRKLVFDAVPRQLKTAIAVGIGLFITFIGLVDAGFVRTSGIPAPPVGLGIGGQLSGWPVLVFCIGLLIMIAMSVQVGARQT